MARALARLEDSVLVVIDLQDAFLKVIPNGDQILKKSIFLVRVARALGVPVLSTVQNVTRMGGMAPALAAHLPAEPRNKMAFSCAGCSEFIQDLEGLGKRQAVLVGIETPICVNQTAHHLLDRGLEVILAVDAISGRSLDMHELAMQRLRHAGCIASQTDSITYEWMLSAEHPSFREVLSLVKEAN